MTNPKFKKRIRNFLFDNFTESKMTSAAERSEKLASARRKLLEYQQKHNHISSPPGLQPAVRLPLPATGAQQTPLIPAPSSSSLASSTSLLPTSTQFDYLKVSAISRPNSVNSPRMSDQQATMEILMKERQDAMSRLQILQGQMSDRDQQLAQLQTALKDSAFQLSEQFNQSASLRQQNDRLAQSERELSAAFGRLQQSFKDQQAKSEQQRQRIEQLESALESSELKQRQSALAAEQTTAAKMQTQQQQRSQFETLAAERLATIDKLQGELNHLHQAVRRLQQEQLDGQQREQQWQSEVQTARLQQQSEIERIKQESNRSVQNQLAQSELLRRDYDALQIAYRNLQESYNQRTTSTSPVATDATRSISVQYPGDGSSVGGGEVLNSAMITPPSSAAMLQEENQSLYAHLQEMRTQYATAMSNLASMREELDRESLAKSRLQAEIEAFEFYKIELERLREIIRDQQTQLSGLDEQTQSQLDYASNVWAEERAQLQDKIDWLQAHNERLSETLKQQHRQTADDSTNPESTEEGSVVVHEATGSNEEFQRVQGENEDLRRMIDDLQSQLDTLQNDYNSVSLMNSQLQMEAETIPDYIERYHEERQLIRTKMKQKDMLIKDMVERYNDLATSVKRLADGRLTSSNTASTDEAVTEQQDAGSATPANEVELARSLATSLRASIELSRQAHLILHPSMLLAENKVEPPPYSPTIAAGPFKAKRKDVLQFPPCAQCDPQLVQL